LAAAFVNFTTIKGNSGWAQRKKEEPIPCPEEHRKVPGQMSVRSFRGWAMLRVGGEVTPERASFLSSSIQASWGSVTYGGPKQKYVKT